jgi:hypothetical protein
VLSSTYDVAVEDPAGRTHLGTARHTRPHLGGADRVEQPAGFGQLPYALLRIWTRTSASPLTEFASLA